MVSKEINARREILSKGLQDGVSRAGDWLQDELRSQVRRANLGEGLERAWRQASYPKIRSKHTLGPAVVIYSKSIRLHRAFDQGPLIRASRKQYLVIALPIAIKMGLGYSTQSRDGGKSWKKAKYSEIDEAAKKLRAEIVSAHNGKRGAAIPKAKRKGRNAPIEGRRIVIMKAKKGDGLVAVYYAPHLRRGHPLFALRKMVKVPKLLDIAGAAETARRMVKREVNAAIAGRLS